MLLSNSYDVNWRSGQVTETRVKNWDGGGLYLQYNDNHITTCIEWVWWHWMSLVSGEPGESRCPRLVCYLWPARTFWHVNKIVHSFILESRVLRVTCIRCNGSNPFSMPDARAPVRLQVEAVGMRRCKYWWPQLFSEYCWVLLSQSLLTDLWLKYWFTSLV